MPGQGAARAAGPSASYKVTEVCKMASSRYYSMGCLCKQMGMGLLGLACLGAGKGQLLNSLAPSLPHTLQVREEEELSGCPQTAIEMPGGKEPFYSPLGALRGRAVTLKNCPQGPSKARASVWSPCQLFGPAGCGIFFQFSAWEVQEEKKHHSGADATCKTGSRRVRWLPGQNCLSSLPAFSPCPSYRCGVTRD